MGARGYTGNFIDKGLSGENVLAYGATGDGATDDRSAIHDAHTGATVAGNDLLFPPGTYIIGSSITFNSNVTLVFAPGATLSIQNGVTITINGKIAATLHQIFALTGTGVATLAAGSATQVYPQWWGAVGDGSNDDTTAIQAAITAAESFKGIVFIPAGEYKITTALDIDNTMSIIGTGKEATTIVAYGGIDGITITPSSAGNADFVRLAYFRIKADTDITGIGISLATGCRGVVIEEIWVGSEFNDLNKSFETGIQITSNSYYNRVLGCYIRNCTNGIKINVAANSNFVGGMTRIINADYGIKDESSTGNHYVTVDIETVGIANAVGIYLDNSDSAMIANCYFELHGSGTPYAIYMDNNVGSTQQIHISGNYYKVDSGTNAIFDNSGNTRHWIDTRSIQFADEFGSSASFKGKLYKATDETNSDNDDVIYETDSTYNPNGHFLFKDTRIVTTGKNTRLELSYPLFQTPLGGIGTMLENRFTYSEEFDNADWVKSNATVASNQADGLDGRVTADRITQTANNGYISQNVAGVENNQDVWGSVWLKKSGRSDEVILRWYNVTDSVEAATNTFTLTADNTWRRYELRYTNAEGKALELRFEIWPSDGSQTENVDVWGAQCVVEESNNPHTNHQGNGYPYIKTTDSPIILDLAGSTAKNLAISDSLYLLGDSPEAQLRNVTAEDSDGGRESAIRFKGIQSGDEETTLGLITVSHDGAVDDEKGKLELGANLGGEGNSPSTLLTVNSNSEVIIKKLLTMIPSALASITAGGGITVTNTHMRVQGDGVAVDITANPQIAAGTDGQRLLLQGGSDTNTVKIDNGTGLHLHNGSLTLHDHDYIYLVYDAGDAEWEEISRSSPVKIVDWSFNSQSVGSGTNFFGGFYIKNSGDSDFTSTETLGTANLSYAAHVALVLGADTVDTLTIRVSGTSIDEEGNRTGSDTEDLVFTHPAVVDDYVEGPKKWIGQVSIDHIGGTAKTCNWLFAKYWDNQNNDFVFLGLEVTFRGGANDSNPDIQVIHHKATGWTYNVGSIPDHPAAIASMQSDHTPEHEVGNNIEGAWKRVDIHEEIASNNGEGTIMCTITNFAKTFEMGNMQIRVRPN